MKFLVITATRAYKKDIQLILKKAAVRSFSFTEVTGYEESSDTNMDSNWFASDTHMKESILFYVFVSKENIDTVFEKVNAFNQKQETLSRIHVAMLNIEKSN